MKNAKILMKVQILAYFKIQRSLPPPPATIPRPRCLCNSPRRCSSTPRRRASCLLGGQQWNPEGYNEQCPGMGRSRTVAGTRLQGADAGVEVRVDGRMPPPHHHRHQGRREDRPHVVTAYDYRRCGGGGA
jgi:hypothetical protein